MIRQSASALAILLLAVLRLSAADTPREILDRALKAHGGEKNLAKTLTGQIKSKATGTFGPPGTDFSITWEETFQLPTVYKRLIEGEAGGMKMRMEYVVRDGSGWIRMGDAPARPFEGKKLPLERSWNAFLAILPAIGASDFKLSPLPKTKVNGSDAVGFKAEKDGTSVEVYFYESSGLLAQTRRLMNHPILNKEVLGEAVYSEYKEVNGIQFPTHFVTIVDGKRLIDLTMTEVKFLEKIDPRVFEMP